MAKRLRDSRKAEAAYEQTLDPRQRTGASTALESEWEDLLRIPALPAG